VVRASMQLRNLIRKCGRSRRWHNRRCCRHNARPRRQQRIKPTPKRPPFLSRFVLFNSAHSVFLLSSCGADILVRDSLLKDILIKLNDIY
jgi:hypothetical protein